MAGRVSIDHLSAVREEHLRYLAEAQKWLDSAAALEAHIKAVIGEADEATIDGKVVYTWKRVGQFAAKRFATEQPELNAKYTRPVTVDQLDVDQLKAEQPEVYAAYRARRFEKK